MPSMEIYIVVDDLPDGAVQVGGKYYQVKKVDKLPEKMDRIIAVIIAEVRSGYELTGVAIDQVKTKDSK